MKKLILFITLTLTSFVNLFAQEVKSDTKSFEEIIAPYLIDLLELVDAGTHLLIETVPEVILQYIYYTAVIEWMYVLLGILFITLFRIIGQNQATVKSKEKPTGETYYKVGKTRWLKESYSDVTGQQVLYYGSKILFPLIGIIIFFTHLSDAIKVTFFPKLFLLETFIHLIK